MPQLCTHCHAKRAAVKLARLAHAASQHALPHVLPLSTPQHSARRHPSQSDQHGRSACVSLNPWTGGGVVSLEIYAALWCALRRCVQLSNASSAAVCFAAVRSA
eukprot:gene9060-biopygen19691